MTQKRPAIATLVVDSRISPFPYRTEDFNPDDLFVKEILETGCEVHRHG